MEEVLQVSIFRTCGGKLKEKREGTLEKGVCLGFINKKNKGKVKDFGKSWEWGGGRGTESFPLAPKRVHVRARVCAFKLTVPTTHLLHTGSRYQRINKRQKCPLRDRGEGMASSTGLISKDASSTHLVPEKPCCRRSSC